MPALNASRDLSRSISGVFGYLFRRRDAAPAPVSKAEALAEIRRKWTAARADYARCKANEDSRGMGEAYKRAKRFANEAFRLEQGQ